MLTDGGLFQDAKVGVRALMRTPGLTLVIVLVLGLGLGINTAVFSIADTALLQGPPVADSDRLVYIMARYGQSERPRPVSYADLRDWRAEAKSFDGLAAFSRERMNINDGTAIAEVYQGLVVSSNILALLRQAPALGRDFGPADEQAGAASVALLSYELWQGRFGGNPNIVGASVRMNGVPTTIVGVMPRDFAFLINADVWMPIVQNANTEKRDARNYGVVAHLRPGATVESARTEMTAIAANLARAYPETNQNVTAAVLTYSELYLGRRATILLFALLGGVTFVLLVVCANVANVQIARTIGRSHEIAIRQALGGGRGRIIRHLLLESVILSLFGGVAAWVIAVVSLRAFDAAISPIKMRWMTFAMDDKAFLYLALTSIGTGLLFGLVPALRMSRLDLNTLLKEESLATSGVGRGTRLSAVLVVAQMAITVMVLTGAGLMIRSLMNVSGANLGVNSSNVLTMHVTLPPGQYPDSEAQVRLTDRLVNELKTIAGVDAVGIGAFPTNGSVQLSYELDGAAMSGPQRPILSSVTISPEYFDTWDVRLERGRPFTADDDTTTPPVAIVNQALVDKLWPGGDPLGKRIHVFTGDGVATWIGVVGVVPNIVHNDIAPGDPDPALYMPYRQRPSQELSVSLRSSVPPRTLMPAVVRATKAVDADLPAFELWTMEERLGRNYLAQRIMTTLFLGFGVFALLLASAGLYAVVANSVSRRSREIAVRSAIGASGSDIIRMVLRQGMFQISIGVVMGLAGAFGLTRLLASGLVGVSAFEPAMLFGAAAILAAAGMLACLVPAVRAAAANPMRTLARE